MFRFDEILRKIRSEVTRGRRTGATGQTRIWIAETAAAGGDSTRPNCQHRTGRVCRKFQRRARPRLLEARFGAQPQTPEGIPFDISWQGKIADSPLSPHNKDLPSEMRRANSSPASVLFLQLFAWNGKGSFCVFSAVLQSRQKPRWQNAHLQAEIRQYQQALTNTRSELQCLGTSRNP